jgi:hypothetical protein
VFVTASVTFLLISVACGTTAGFITGRFYPSQHSRRFQETIADAYYTAAEVQDAERAEFYTGRHQSVTQDMEQRYAEAQAQDHSDDTVAEHTEWLKELREEGEEEDPPVPQPAPVPPILTDVAGQILAIPTHQPPQPPQPAPTPPDPYSREFTDRFARAAEEQARDWPGQEDAERYITAEDLDRAREQAARDIEAAFLGDIQDWDPVGVRPSIFADLPPFEPYTRELREPWKSVKLTVEFPGRAAYEDLARQWAERFEETRHAIYVLDESDPIAIVAEAPSDWLCEHADRHETETRYAIADEDTWAADFARRTDAMADDINAAMGWEPSCPASL